MAKERRGAKLIVTKNDGQLIEGELITVKPNSLLLLDTEGKDVSIDIVDIKVITIVKKSKALQGAGLGLLIGGGSMFLYAQIVDGETPKIIVLLFTLGAAGIGASVGGITGALLGTDKTIRIEGKSDSEIREALDKLRKKARIRDYK